MYQEKQNTEIISLDKDIKVVGLNLQNSGLPITFESLGKMWGIYSEEHKTKTKNVITPVVEYGICLNKVPDYLVGCEVSEYEDVKKEFFSFTIPAGNYIKDSYNADTYESLVSVKLLERQKAVKKWAKENKLKIDGNFVAEVYPDEMVNMEYPAMYCLYPIVS